MTSIPRPTTADTPLAASRRTVLRTAAAAAVAGLAAPAIAQAKKKLRVGYLHTPAVDGHLWLGQQMGAFAKHGLELEPIVFTTGLEIFQAMIGGSLDVLATGAVVSNFPARGQGKVFLLNDIEYATAQLWVRDDAIKSVADLKGRQIATTTGTTAHVFLDRALRAAKLEPAKDVQLVNQRMGDAVTAFVSGAVPAVALWVPFDQVVKTRVPGARKLTDASAFFPQAAIMGGWAARNDYYDANRATIKQLIAAWGEANDRIIADPAAAAEALQKLQYKDIPLADFQAQFQHAKYYSTAEWRAKYADGTATRWLQQVSDFFVQSANIPNAVPAERYFDPKPFLEIYKA